MMVKLFKRFSFVMLVLLFSIVAMGQNSLPSCVITVPHCNAYFQEGTDITIRVYSTDFGGTYSGGTVTKVEFFNGDIKLGETASATSNTYTYLWPQVPAGTYTIKAKATNNDNAVSTSAGVVITVGTTPVTSFGISATKGKYLANIITNSVRSDYKTYWNGVTSENACKWGSVEGTRDVMNWSGADVAYNHAKKNNMMFRYHALVWGKQYPTWIETLTPTEFQAEMEEYMAAVAARYPLIDQIDVLNENMYLNTWDGKEHAPGTPFFRAGLGGPGVTGYDWVIWLFEKARQYFPNAKLIMNDFELETNTNGVNEMLAVVKVLRDRNLIDGFGTQAHYFNVDNISSSNLQNALNLMDNSGVPIYVTELDLKGSSTTEASQKNSYASSFPVYWNHPAVAGITLWGYVEGSTWATGTGILNQNGTERTAMTWLKTFMDARPYVGYPFDDSIKTIKQGDNLLINGEFDNSTFAWEINNYNGVLGTMSVVFDANMSGGNTLQVSPTVVGSANWEIQISQNAPFEAGKNYTLSFMAKADAPRSMSVAMQMANIPNTTYLEEPISLTTSNQTFTFPFKPTVTDATNKLKFFVGSEASILYIDNIAFKEDMDISVKQSEAEPSVSIYPNPVISGKVLISSKSFEPIQSIDIIDIQGKIVKTITLNNTSAQIELSGLQKGLYFAQIKIGISTINQKIIIL